MTDKPILFNTPMVQAILNGRKTQTRRIIKMPSWGVGWEYFETDGRKAEVSSKNGCVAEILCPYGKVNDCLWVREAYCVYDDINGSECWYYKADDPNHLRPPLFAEDLTWKPSIHMPRGMCRLRLKISNVRVERLQSISEEDAIAEGIQVETDCKNSPVDSFRSLWQSINGADSWNENPWVWVITFISK